MHDVDNVNLNFNTINLLATFLTLERSQKIDDHESSIYFFGSRAITLKWITDIV